LATALIEPLLLSASHLARADEPAGITSRRRTSRQNGLFRMTPPNRDPGGDPDDAATQNIEDFEASGFGFGPIDEHLYFGLLTDFRRT
jgi:hypothetical protein